MFRRAFIAVVSQSHHKLPLFQVSRNNYRCSSKLSYHSTSYLSIRGKKINSIAASDEDEGTDDSIDDDTSATQSEIDLKLLESFKHGRKGKERKDSITLEILKERMTHHNRIQDLVVDDDMVSDYKQKLDRLDSLGLGSKRRKYQVYSGLSFHSTESDTKKTLTGAGGFAVHLSSSSSNWPLFKHILPEIAFAGHSNCGKSTLVNAISGLHPSRGPASVSDRAGWTDQICFYQLGKKPPVLIMADLPGYGHAVTNADMKKHWKLMTRDYLSTRLVLSRTYILVDCTRGLCEGDISIIKYLAKAKREWAIIMTKADLLSVDALAKSMTIVENHITDALGVEYINKYNSVMMSSNSKTIIPVSASTGAGIHQLWLEIKDCSKKNASNDVLGNEFAVREHVLAGRMRVQIQQDVQAKMGKMVKIK